VFDLYCAQPSNLFPECSVIESVSRLVTEVLILPVDDFCSILRSVEICVIKIIKPLQHFKCCVQVLLLVSETDSVGERHEGIEHIETKPWLSVVTRE
jgi:hypothetical protein